MEDGPERLGLEVTGAKSGGSHLSRLILRDSPSLLDVDLAAIAANTRQIRALVGDQCELYAALKCDAYGLGLIPVATTILASGGDAISVSRLGDGVALRMAGVRVPLLVYPSQPVDADVAHAVDEHQLMPAVADLGSAQQLSEHVHHETPVLLKVDVGLRRLGVRPEDGLEIARRIQALPRVRLDGVVTHLHVPPDPVPPGYLEWQFRRLTRLFDQLDEAGLPARVRLAASSAVLRLTSTMNLTAVDPGRLFLGLVGTGPQTASLNLHSAVRSLRSRLISVKDVPPDEFSDLAQIPVGTGIRLGVFPLGTADGLRQACGREVLIRGRRVPVFDAISLEHCRVNLTECPDAAVGDEVVLIGRQAGDEITLEEIAEHHRIPPVAVCTAIAPSIGRRYAQ